ncbi:DUF2007 domain-containing protein [Chloroflexota bacterium]
MKKEEASSKDRLVPVYKAAGEAEALVIKGLLESHGIPCLLRSNASPSVHVFAVDGMGEVRVMVEESQTEKAKRLIKGERRV